MNGAVYELAVGRPPTDQEEALELACERALFCPDVHEDRSGDGLRGHAAWLMKSSWWYFGWD